MSTEQDDPETLRSLCTPEEWQRASRLAGTPEETARRVLDARREEIEKAWAAGLLYRMAEDLHRLCGGGEMDYPGWFECFPGEGDA